MEKNKENQREGHETLTGLSAEILRGRQSVRATFKLPLPIIELLSLAASQLGLKQKSLFDQLVEDRETLEQVALDASSYAPVQSQRQQKTYVVSRNSLVTLEYVAKTHGMPRDLLVEISIQRLLPVLSAEQQKQGHRRHILSEMQAFLGQGQEILANAGYHLGENDPFIRQLAAVIAHLNASVNFLSDQVEQGRDIEGFF